MPTPCMRDSRSHLSPGGTDWAFWTTRLMTSKNTKMIFYWRDEDCGVMLHMRMVLVIAAGTFCLLARCASVLWDRLA